jgi:hypothetical protein
MPFERHSQTTKADRATNVAAIRDLEGCITLLGPVQLCWSLSLTPPQASVSLKIFGTTIASGTISESSPCLDIDAKFGIGEAHLSVCLDIPGRRITAKGKASAFGESVSFELTLVQW